MTTSNTIKNEKERHNLSEVIPLAIPICVYIDVTNRCNFTCPWCPTGENLETNEGRGFMSPDLFKKIVDDLKTLVSKHQKKVKSLNMFWMGEPLLNKNYFEMVRYAKDANIAEAIITTTNGSIINESHAKKFVESGVDFIVVSFYGKNDQEYKTVNRNIGFNNICKNTRKVIEARESANSNTPKIAAKFFEKDDKLHDLLVKKLKCVDSVGVESPFNWSQEFTEQTNKTVKVENMGPMEICPSPWFVMSIGWKGHVGVCCADWKYEINVGNIQTQSVEEVWNGEKRVELLKKISEMRYEEIPSCKGCTYYKISHDPSTNIDQFVRENPQKALSTYT